MGRQVDGAGFAELFTGFTDSAFRLETLDCYNEPIEREAIRRFVAGEPPDDSWTVDYQALLREASTTGRRVQRVRVLALPPTPYQRFVMDLAARCNVPAGEHLRVLDKSEAVRFGVPLGQDFWLFDNKMAALMTFADGTFVAAEVIDDDSVVLARLRNLRERAWHAAHPGREQDFAAHR